MPDILAEFHRVYHAAGRRLKDLGGGIAMRLGTDDFCLVGGAVRDVVLGEITGRRVVPKDFDIIMGARPNLTNNPMVSNVRSNSMGGTKAVLRDVGELDIFQYYTHDVPPIISIYFDFVCNSLYYDMRRNCLEYSIYFMYFLEQSILRTTIGYQGPIENIIARAIKFQIKFARDFGLRVRLGDDILDMIAGRTASDDAKVVAYVNGKISDAELRRCVMTQYQQYRNLYRPNMMDIYQYVVHKPRGQR